DSCGNVNSETRTVTIAVTDTDAPVWDGEDVELTADCAADIDSLLAEHVPTATDNCSDVIIAVSSDETTASICAGSYLRTVGYVVSDACGNVNATTRFVTITVTDTSAPEWEDDDLTLSANCGDNIEGILGANLPTAIDNCNDVIVTISIDETTANICAGSYLRTVGYVVSDACGNVSTTTRFVTITVTDTEAPVWTSDNLSLNADCNEDMEMLLAENLPAATDNCSMVNVTISSDKID